MNKNVASQKVTLLAIDTANNVPKTGDAANLTAYVSIDDGSVTVLGDTSATELDATNAPGLYSFDLTQGETNGNKLLFSGKSSTANIRLVPLLVYTRPPNFQTLTIANSCVDADLERIAGSAVSTSTAQLGVNAVQAGGTAWGSGAITAASIASAALAKAKFASDTGLIPTLTGTASAGGATTITLTGGVATNDYYNGSLVYILSGTGAGQARFITDYVGATTVATVDTWITNPDNTSVFAVLPSFAITAAAIQSGLATQTSVDVIDGIVDAIVADTNELQTDWADGGRLDLLIDSIISKVDTIDDFLDTEIAAILEDTGTTLDDFIDTEVAAIKAKTDSLTFTVASVLDANIQRVNDVALVGDGAGTPWGP